MIRTVSFTLNSNNARMSIQHDLRIWQRIEEAFESIDVLTQTEIAQKLKISQSSVSKWKRGINVPSVSTAVDVSLMTGYNVQWLYTGKGPRKISGENSEAAQLIDLLESLPAKERQEVLNFARFQSKQSND